jgi:hypothetical protein
MAFAKKELFFRFYSSKYLKMSVLFNDCCRNFSLIAIEHRKIDAKI